MADELRTGYSAEEFDEETSLSHYGTKRHSGRYPWGSGENPYQRLDGKTSFLGRYRELKKTMPQTQIARVMGFRNTDELRKAVSTANREVTQYFYNEAYKLKQKGMSTTAIAKRLGKNESTIRGMLDEARRERLTKTQKNADILKEAVDRYGYIDIGGGVEQHLGITQTRLKNAVDILVKKEGYVRDSIKVEQLGTGNLTTIAVLAKPGTTKKDIWEHSKDIHLPFPAYSEDGGETMTKVVPPTSVDSKRIQIKYAEDGGEDRDGLIEIRRGLNDLSLGNAKYVQTRIAVDGTHYLKGMAVYSDDLPDGVDIRFNTNKHKGTPMLGPKDNTVLKPMAVDDPENPFGASIKPDDKLIRAQRYFTDENGERKLSPINVVNEEGDWDKWSKTLSSQFLSKQPVSLAKQQLKLASDISESEFEDIKKLTNPTVKRMLLEEFAGGCEHDSWHLAAASLPRQATKVILPVPSLKENEVYAPSFKEGEEVVLIRHPHAGIFEIPRLTVTHRNPEGKNVVGNALDAIGINHKTAEQLSGADFDGDSVLVIPTKGANIQTETVRKELKAFDPKAEYPAYPGMHHMTKREKGLEMGKISNLITDMTIMGAPESDIIKAVKHSMVVIDAEKHNLDYKQSEKDNEIPQLRLKWLGSENKGASTLVSKASSEIRIPRRKEKPLWVVKQNPEEYERWKNGEIIWEDTGRTRNKATLPRKLMTPEEKEAWDTKDKAVRNEILKRAKADGRAVYKEETLMEKTAKLAVEQDAYNLVSGNRDNTTRIEQAYADYSNYMKDLARRARKEARALEDIEYSPSANKTYADEVASLNAKLKIALRNAPLERQAQLLASREVAAKFYANPNLDEEHRKRIKGRALDNARKKVNPGGKQSINITDREWEAINAGAITKTKLKAILGEANKDRVKQLASPRAGNPMSAAKVARAKSMLKLGHTQADVADALGVSVGTLVDAIGVANFEN